MTYSEKSDLLQISDKGEGRCHSLKKAYRILKRSDFVRINENNRKVQNQHFVALYQKGSTGRTRLGITITKKVGNAVARNQIKRYVREYYRQNRHTIRIGTDINVIAKKRASGIPSKEAQMSLEDLFCKIRKKDKDEGRLEKSNSFGH